MTTKEQREFETARLIVERVRQRLGIPRDYRLRDWISDQQALRDSVRRKQALREAEAARIAQFDAWRHGTKA